MGYDPSIIRSLARRGSVVCPDAVRGYPGAGRLTEWQVQAETEYLGLITFLF